MSTTQAQDHRPKERLVFNGLLAFVPLIITLFAIYAFFSIAIDLRAVPRLLERQEARETSDSA